MPDHYAGITEAPGCDVNTLSDHFVQPIGDGDLQINFSPIEVSRLLTLARFGRTHEWHLNALSWRTQAPAHVLHCDGFL